MHFYPELCAARAQALRDQAQQARAVREARAAQVRQPTLARLSLRPA